MRNLYNIKYLERDNIKESLQHILETPLFIAVAAMGYGKTTIIHNFLEKQKEIDFIWLSLIENDVDDVWIWQRLCELLREDRPTVASQMEMLSLPRTRSEFEAFIKILTGEFENPFYIVFDDYHECCSKTLNHLIETLTYAEIPNLHIGIISRFYPEIPYDEMFLKGYCSLIEQHSFVLSLDEVTEFFRINGVLLSEEEKEILYGYTDGWMSATYLALLDYKKNKRLENMGTLPILCELLFMTNCQTI